MKRWKLWRIVCMILVVTLALVPVHPVAAHAQSADGVGAMLQMSDRDCLSALQAKGLELPAVYQHDPDYAAQVVRMILTDYQKGMANPDSVPYNYTELVALAQNVYRTIGAATNAVSGQGVQAAAAYTLKDSTVIGSWKDSYTNYNCYLYALGKTSGGKHNPGYYSGQSFSMSLSISAMANLVIDDLSTLGYWATKTSAKPTSLQSYESVMCMRKGTADFHFMKGSHSTTSWTHKPGLTNPLTWKYTTPNYKTWTNECSVYDVCYAGDLTYTSTIYYIRYWSKNGPGPQPNAIDPEQE